MASLSRVVLWLDRPAGVSALFEALTRGAGMAAQRAPAAPSGGTDGQQPLSAFLGPGVFSAAVGDGRTSVELVSLDWVERLRRVARRPRASQLLAVCLCGVRDAALTDQRPSAVAAAAFLQPLAWLATPAVHPLLLCEAAGTLDMRHMQGEPHRQHLRHPLHAQQLEQQQLRADADAGATVKEVVLGEDESRFVAAHGLVQRLGCTPLSPGLVGLGPGGATMSDHAPALRLLPAATSALVLRVPSLAAATQRLAACGVETRVVRRFGQSAGPRVADDVALLAPFLAGLDLRLSETAQYDRQFAEPCGDAEGSTIARGTGRMGGRDDLGQLSCASVSGLEVTERLNRWPRRMLLSLGASARPRY